MEIKKRAKQGSLLGLPLALLRPNRLLLKKFILLIRGAFVDPNLLISALRLGVPRGLRPALGALVPSRIFRAVLGSLFTLMVSGFAHPANRLFCLSIVCFAEGEGNPRSPRESSLSPS